MTKEELAELVPQIFERIHRKSAINFRYRFVPNEQDKKLLSAFVEWFTSQHTKAELSPELVVTYFTF